MKRLLAINTLCLLLLIAGHYFSSQALTGSYTTGVMQGIAQACIEGFEPISATFSCGEAIAIYNPNFSDAAKSEMHINTFIFMAIEVVLFILLISSLIFWYRAIKRSNKKIQGAQKGAPVI